MSIMKTQEILRQTFQCERLTGNEDNFQLISNFSNNISKELVDILQGEAWDTDTEKTSAYYLIKNQSGDIMLFFSLKCGVLFTPFDNEIWVATKNKLADAQNSDYMKQPQEQLEVSAKLKATAPGEPEQYSDYTTDNKDRIIKELINDIQAEQSVSILRVENTYAGIELEYFCANDDMREYFRSCGLNCPRMGEAMFWGHIVPKIVEAQDLIGCKYVYLFAADEPSNGGLIAYYRELGFRQAVNMGVCKSNSNLAFTFMYQEITELLKKQQTYFDALDAVGAK